MSPVTCGCRILMEMVFFPLFSLHLCLAACLFPLDGMSLSKLFPFAIRMCLCIIFRLRGLLVERFVWYKNCKLSNYKILILTISPHNL